MALRSPSASCSNSMASPRSRRARASTSGMPGRIPRSHPPRHDAVTRRTPRSTTKTRRMRSAIEGNASPTASDRLRSAGQNGSQRAITRRMVACSTPRGSSPAHRAPTGRASTVHDPDDAPNAAPELVPPRPRMVLRGTDPRARRRSASPSPRRSRSHDGPPVATTPFLARAGGATRQRARTEPPRRRNGRTGTTRPATGSRRRFGRSPRVPRATAGSARGDSGRMPRPATAATRRRSCRGHRPRSPRTPHDGSPARWPRYGSASGPRPARPIRADVPTNARPPDARRDLPQDRERTIA